MSDSITKTCTKCHCELPATAEFWYAAKNGKYGLQSVCKTCKSKAVCKYPKVPEGYKLCRKCLEVYPATHEYFYESKGELTSPCKHCRAEQGKEQYEANKEAYNAKSRQYYADNKERISEQNREYREKNKDRIAASQKRYYEENRELHNERTRQYYQKNRARIYAKNREYKERNKEWYREYDREYRIKNKERIYEQKKQWVKKNRDGINASHRAFYRLNRAKIAQWQREYAKAYPEKKVIREARRRARKRQLPSTFTAQDWQFCIEYFNYTCAVCGCQLRDMFGNIEPHADHWIPLANPDCPGTVPRNMVCLCNSCNLSKGAKLPEKWLTEGYGAKKAKQILQRIQNYFEGL